MPKHTKSAENYQITLTRKKVVDEVMGIVEKPVREAWNRSNTLSVFRRQVRLLRNRMGVSQSVMAKMIGVTQGRYSNIESGKHNISLDTACRIADVFNCSVCLLLTSFQQQIISMKVPEIEIPHPYMLDYSQCESEVVELEMELRKAQRQLVTMGHLDDKVGIREKLLTDAQRRRLSVDESNMFVGDVPEEE